MAYIEKRKNKENETIYRVRIRLKGFPKQTATFKRLTDAKRWEKETETAILNGRHFTPASTSKKHTLSEAIDRYFNGFFPSRCEEYRKEITTHLEWCKKTLGDYWLTDITSSLFIEARDKLIQAHELGGEKPSVAVLYEVKQYLQRYKTYSYHC